jgi:hypothetical protein
MEESIAVNKGTLLYESLVDLARITNHELESKEFDNYLIEVINEYVSKREAEIEDKGRTELIDCEKVILRKIVKHINIHRSIKSNHVKDVEGAYDFTYAEYTSVTERVLKGIDLDKGYILSGDKGLMYPYEFEGVFFYLAMKPGIGRDLDLYRKDVCVR